MTQCKQMQPKMLIFTLCDAIFHQTTPENSIAPKSSLVLVIAINHFEQQKKLQISTLHTKQLFKYFGHFHLKKKIFEKFQLKLVQ